MVEELTEMEKDVLKEITSIASGNASTILSKKIGKEIKLSIPFQKLTSLKEVEKNIPIPKGIAICTFARLKGDLLGSVMLTFDRKSAFALADLLQKKKLGTTEWLSEKDQKELIYLSNSLLQSYLKAMSNFLKLNTGISEIKIFSTVGDAIVDLLYLTKPQGPILTLGTEFFPQGILKGKLLFIFFLPKQGVVSLLREANLLLDGEEKR